MSFAPTTSLPYEFAATRQLIALAAEDCQKPWHKWEICILKARYEAFKVPFSCARETFEYSLKPLANTCQLLFQGELSESLTSLANEEWQQVFKGVALTVASIAYALLGIVVGASFLRQFANLEAVEKPLEKQAKEPLKAASGETEPPEPVDIPIKDDSDSVPLETQQHDLAAPAVENDSEDTSPINSSDSDSDETPITSTANSPERTQLEGEIAFFIADCQTVIEFPDNDPNAQIKSIDGRLQRTNGLNWVTGYVYGTVLSNTAVDLENTCQKAKEQVDLLLTNLEAQQPDRNSKSIRYLLDAINLEGRLLQGMQNILKTYTQRYGEEYAGVKCLTKICSDIEQASKDHNERYAKIIEPFKDDLSGSLTQQETEPFSSLSAYCTAYCPLDLPSNRADKLSDCGKELVSRILNGEEVSLSADAAKAQDELAAITWFLMRLALKKSKGEGFEEGAFIVEDPDQRLSKFLYTAPAIYDRFSTHLFGRSPPLHKGVDVFNGLLPARKRTLLFTNAKAPPFAERAVDLLYIKPENYSADPTQTWDAAMHFSELFSAQYNKVMHPGSDDLPEMRKERVPAAALEAFLALITQVTTLDNQSLNEAIEAATKLPFDNAKAKASAKMWGIAYMQRVVDVLVQEKPSIDCKAFKATVEDLDHLDMRTGREVYLTLTDISK